MKIRYMSDLHLEFGDHQLTKMEDEHEQILVLAGDIGLAANLGFLEFLNDACNRFRDVIYIMGNHEHYHSDYGDTFSTITNNFDSLYGQQNIHFLENEVLKIENVSFVCSTLWTSFNNGDPIAMNIARMKINDYCVIGKFSPIISLYIHRKSSEFIFNSIKSEKNAGQKVVVVTHMLPSYGSIHDDFRTPAAMQLNYSYFTSLENEIIDTDPDFWIHGHTHESFDYEIGNTRILCNPRGYTPDALNKNFDDTLLLEI